MISQKQFTAKSVYGCAFHNNQVLLVFDPRSGKWELPGGGVDQAETDDQALIREIKEETGLNADASEKRLIDRVEGYYKRAEQEYILKTDRHYFQIKIKNPNGKILDKGNKDDIEECQWVKLAELNRLEIAETDKSVIQKLKQLNS